MFTLTEKEKATLDAWLEEQEKLAVKMQRESYAQSIVDDPAMPRNPFKELLLDAGKAYYGAIGGAVTYRFTPNSIGTVIVVEHGYTKNEIDITDYDSF